MEEELRCPLCKELYVNPVLLPCYHGLCLACALDTQVQIANNGSRSSSSSSNKSNSSTLSNYQTPINHQSKQFRNGPVTRNNSANSSTSESISSDQDADKVSILSEADSGVICISRPNSFAGTPNVHALIPPCGGAVYSLTCPMCRKIIFFDENGARNLPRYRTMESIVDRFCEREALRCQMCEIDPKMAVVLCEQCDIRYCDSCRELYHPIRGPLTKHTLVSPIGATTIIRETICIEHCTEPLSVYCSSCKIALCQRCLTENRHQSHEIQSIASISKLQKVSRICKNMGKLGNHYGL